MFDVTKRHGSTSASTCDTKIAQSHSNFAIVGIRYQMSNSNYGQNSLFRYYSSLARTHRRSSPFNVAPLDVLQVGFANMLFN
jgi:hypothetical protein